MAKKKPPVPVPVASGRQRWVALAVAGAVLLAVVILIGVIAGGNTSDDDDSGSQSALPGADITCVSDTRMDHYSTEDKVSVVHTDSPGYAGPLSPRDDPEYTVNPPSGGDHLSRAVAPGTYEGERVPPDGNLVHSLEHGYVIIWHQPGLSDDDLSAIDDVRAKYARDVLVVERSAMDKPVAATAWGNRLLCDGVNSAALGNFVQHFRNQAPEKIPH
jgi:hypothetical protein